jgi:hypothetical protein
VRQRRGKKGRLRKVALLGKQNGLGTYDADVFEHELGLRVETQLAQVAGTPNVNVRNVYKQKT